MKASYLNITPLDGVFGAVVRDIELRSLEETEWRAIHAAWIEYGLLIFSDQFLTRHEQDDFAQRFGDLEFTAAPISNLTKDGDVISDANTDVIKSIRGNEGWHHDSTYMPIQARGAVFTAEVVPTKGAATGFADMRAAYESLDQSTRDLLANKRAYHSLYYSQGRAGYLPTKNADGGYDLYGYHQYDTPLRPLVKVHPDTGRPNLNIGRHAHDVVGMDPDASTRLVDEINEQAVSNESRVYYHQWTVGDAIVWDNRRLMHCATPFDITEPRRMWHTRIAGDPASEAALNHTN